MSEFCFLDKVIIDKDNRKFYQLTRFSDSYLFSWNVSIVEHSVMKDIITSNAELVKDFSEENDYLISNAPRINQAEAYLVNMDITSSIYTVYDLLLQLVYANAYIIPLDLYVANEEYKNMVGYASFVNLRVSDSSMFVGVSYISDSSWKTFSVISVDKEDHLVSDEFVIAVKRGESDSLSLLQPLTKLDSVIVDGAVCDTYLYSNNYALFPSYQPFYHLSAPMLNYLQYQSTVYKVAKNFLNMFQERSSMDIKPTVGYERDIRKSVNVETKTPVPGVRRRSDIIRQLSECADMPMDDLVKTLGLNCLEKFPVKIILQFPANALLSSIALVLPRLKESGLVYALTLFKMRAVIFAEDVKFPFDFDDYPLYGGVSDFSSDLKKVRR
jgi:hypothetical protein